MTYPSTTHRSKVTLTDAVAVTPDANSLVEQLFSSETLIEYPAGIARDATRARDLDIVGFRMPLSREAVEIVKAQDLFN